MQKNPEKKSSIIKPQWYSGLTCVGKGGGGGKSLIGSFGICHKNVFKTKMSFSCKAWTWSSPKLTDVWLQGLVQAHLYVKSWINPLRFTLAVILNLFWKEKKPHKTTTKTGNLSIYSFRQKVDL